MSSQRPSDVNIDEYKIKKIKNQIFLFSITRPGFHFEVPTKYKVATNIISYEDTGKSSSRKLRRVSYYTLYRMDPQNTHSANVVFCLCVFFCFTTMSTQTHNQKHKNVYIITCWWCSGWAVPVCFCSWHHVLFRDCSHLYFVISPTLGA